MRIPTAEFVCMSEGCGLLFVPHTGPVAEVVRFSRGCLRASALAVFIKRDFLLGSELVPVGSSLVLLPPGKADTLLVFQPLLRACQPTGLSPSLAGKLGFSGTYSVWTNEILHDKDF